MSDSETDLFPGNIYTFRNESTTVSAKGPNVNSINITGLNFRSNMLSSTMQPRNFERSRYAESVCDQRSMYYRRETSPMSMYSGIDRPRNFHNSFYLGRMSSQRSMYSGRGGSPMSMRSIDSNVSVSAADIALAFKNVKFNKYDLRVIKDAYNKLMKKRVRKKIEKRRNMRLFLKGYRRKSGYDSGEQGSDSSISSSDDCTSTNSALCKDNMSNCRSTLTDIANFRQNIRESNMYNDRSDNFRSNAFRNMYPLCSSNRRDQFNSQKHNMTTEFQNVTKTTQHITNTKKSIPATRNVLDAAPNKISNTTHSQSYQSQRERFKNNFLLPSQRFNKSTASVAIPEHDKCSNEGKRNLDNDDNICSDNKRKKLSMSKQVKSTTKPSNNKAKTVLKECNNNKDTIDEKKADDFEFVKPLFPIQRMAAGKVKEVLISKSNVPLTDVTIPPLPTVLKENITSQESVEIITNSSKPIETNAKPSKNIIAEKQSAEPVDPGQDTTENSMRPSFIKRKLFTQKMDMTESKCLSVEALNINSPQVDIYSPIQREKHKARKLVTNQSCLNRDVNQEDSNLLDLIHKIVPPDRMNMTNVSNKTSRNSKSSHDIKNCDEDKWDVTSVITTCNNDDASDTYTDEDIFNDNNKKPRKCKRKEKPVKNQQGTLIPECKVVIENNLKINISKSGSNGDNKGTGLNCAKLFWDTDFESDAENTITKKSTVMEHSKTGFSNNSTHGSVDISKNDSNMTQHDAMTMQATKKQCNMAVVGPTLKKYKINKNFTVKAFGTPIKIKADLNHKNVKENKEKHSKDSNKPSNKKQNTVLPKPNKNTINVQNKNSDAQKTAKKVEPKEKIPDKEKLTESHNKIKEKPKVITRTANSKSSTALNETINNGILSRSNRTPKIKMCCGNKVEKENKIKTANTKPKIEKKNAKENNNKAHSKTANKSNNISSEKEEKKGKNAKKKPAPIIECEPMNRTLRTRIVDLSSSFNTSNENITNITVKCLRTRQINLSSSMDDSTLQGNIVTKKRIQKLPQKKLNLK